MWIPQELDFFHINPLCTGGGHIYHTQALNFFCRLKINLYYLFIYYIPLLVKQRITIEDLSDWLILLLLIEITLYFSSIVPVNIRSYLISCLVILNGQL